MSAKLISIAACRTPLRQNTVLAALSRIWTKWGYEVVVGSSYHDHADVCILHHDVTTLDRDDLPTPPSGAPVINGRVLDIAKRTFSMLLLQPGDDWAGPVIIKTNLNHFGAPERDRVCEGWRRRLRRKLAKVSWRMAGTLAKHNYPVVGHIREVPNWVWRDRDLIVEKFMPEREGDLYCQRGWLFLGGKGYGYRLFADQPVVKTGTMVRYEYIDDVPPPIMAQRERMGFDFGKFDYVQPEDEPILLDANKTPTFVGTGESPRMLHLAAGIEDFM